MLPTECLWGSGIIFVTNRINTATDSISVKQRSKGVPLLKCLVLGLAERLLLFERVSEVHSSDVFTLTCCDNALVPR